ncbi:hypothetical protein N9L68_05545 [bacterium]|nr:hypothetical protein [bacterium]
MTTGWLKGRGRQNKGDSARHRGVWSRRTEPRKKQIVGNYQGVIKCKNILRPPAERQYDVGLFAKLVGTPWNPRLGSVERISGGPPVQPSPGSLRRGSLRREHKDYLEAVEDRQEMEINFLDRAQEATGAQETHPEDQDATPTGKKSDGGGDEQKLVEDMQLQ